jgi:two-component system, chemotaxis family, sensor kinase CheA
MDRWNVTSEELEIFVAEAEEMLQQMTENLLKLEQGSDDPRLLQSIFRAAHTIKGGAATIGHEQMTHLAHQMEDLFDMMREGELQPDSRLINILLEGVDNLSIMIVDLSSLDTDYTPDLSHITEQLNSYLHGTGNVEEAYQEIEALPPPQLPLQMPVLETGYSLYNILVRLKDKADLPAIRFLQVYMGLYQQGRILECDPSQEQIEREEVGSEMRMWLSSSSSKTELEATIREIDDIQFFEVAPFSDGIEAKPDETVKDGVEAGHTEASGDGEVDPVSAQTRRTTSIRVDVERLDRIMNLVGELVVERNNIARIAMLLDIENNDSPVVAQLKQAVNQLNVIGNELQHEILKTRMVPLERVFKRFPRTVRDLAQKLDKHVDFIIEGAETELDRLIIEEISDPLLHILRNALDHGVELPQRRQMVDKNPTARLWLRARYQDGAVFIEIEDDGRGIDPEAVKRRAVEKGIITQPEADRMSEEEAVHLIFRAGFSTATTVTDVSGRGVGLDIVQNNIEKLGGTVAVYSEPGSGTRFILRLPLTLAIIKALLVDSGNHTYALPLGAVNQITRVDKTQVHTVEELPVIRFQNDFIPLVRLDKALGMGQNKDIKSANGTATHNGNHNGKNDYGGGTFRAMASRANRG